MDRIALEILTVELRHDAAVIAEGISPHSPKLALQSGSEQPQSRVPLLHPRPTNECRR